MRPTYDLIIWEEEYAAADLIQDSYDYHFGSQSRQFWSWR